MPHRDPNFDLEYLETWVPLPLFSRRIPIEGQNMLQLPKIDAKRIRGF
jgi:hypothetical protein